MARLTCENCAFIDVRDWQREQRLSHGQAFRCSWKRLGKPVGSIFVFINDDGSAVLTHQVRAPGETAWRTIQQRVPIGSTRCNLGGQRAWFCCPAYSGGRLCGRRAAILYCPDDVLACRSCFGLAYTSQQETPKFRSIRRSRKIRMRLGGTEDLFKPFPQRPSGMHRTTYRRLRALGEAADARAFGICDNLGSARDAELAADRIALANYGLYAERRCSPNKEAAGFAREPPFK